MLKKILIALLAVAMCLALVACTTTTPVEEPVDDAVEAPVEDGTEDVVEEEPVEEEPVEEPEAAIDTSEFVVIDHVVLGDPDANDNWRVVQDEANKYLESKINAHHELNWTGWTDYKSKYDMMVASGEELDLVDCASTWLDLWPHASKGAWYILDDLLPVYAPLTWAEISPDVWDCAKYKGQIVCIPEDCYPQAVNHGLFYRGDWAKEAGVYDIRSYADLEVYLQWIVDNKAADGVVPYDTSDAGGLFSGYIYTETEYILTQAAGLMAESWENYWKLVDVNQSEAAKEYYALAKSWYEKSFWRTDALNYTGSSRDQMRAGLGGLDQHHVETYTGLVVDMEEKIPGSDLKMFQWWMGKTNNGVGEPVTHGAQTISVNSKNPERALMVYEMLRQDETFFHYIHYGIEGWQYVINEDGLRAEPEGYDSAVDGYWSNFWCGRPGKFLIPHVKDWPNKTAYTAEALSHLKLYPYGSFIFDKAPISAEVDAVNAVNTAHRPALYLGMAGDPEVALAAYIAERDAAGFQVLFDECQRQMDEYHDYMEGN
ncbi:MAG: ABC transporter substrate-binding protein [Christensenellales bacterium]